MGSCPAKAKVFHLRIASLNSAAENPQPAAKTQRIRSSPWKLLGTKAMIIDLKVEPQAAVSQA